MASILGDVYKQYKEDTEFIAGWLAEESLQCGYALHTVGAQPLSKGSGRLKGKARKQAQESAAKSTKSATDSNSYVIRISDFIPMAQKITEKLPRLRVPVLVERVFGRAISERRRVSEWFSSCHGQDSGHASDLRHADFINVLEAAFAILCPFTEIIQKPGRSHKHISPGAELLPLRNAFAGLTVEDLLNEPEDQDVANDTHVDDDQRLPKIASVSLQKDEAEKEEEFYFAIECFLEEVHTTRTMILEAWHLYQHTGYDLVIATLLTNTAIELIRQAEDQLDLLLERPAKYPAAKFPVWSFPAILYYQLHGSMHNTPIEMVVLPSVGVTVSSGGECLHTDWCMYHAYSGIKYYLHFSQRHAKGVKNAVAAVDRASFRGQLPDTAWRALEWTTILRVATVMSSSTFALDEVTRGIRHAFTTSTVPLWVTFGIQTLLDIEDVFGPSLDKAYKDLKAHVHYTSTALARDLERPRPFPIKSNERAHAVRAAKTLEDIRDWTLNDLFGSMLKQQPGMHTHPILGRVTRQPHYLLTHHPLRCGMLKYNLHLQMHATGTGVESQALVISTLAHLYAACKMLLSGRSYLA